MVERWITPRPTQNLDIARDQQHLFEDELRWTAGPAHALLTKFLLKPRGQPSRDASPVQILGAGS